MKIILLAGLCASLIQAETVAPEHPATATAATAGSGLTIDGNPKQQTGFYTFIMRIGSRITLGTFARITHYGNDSERKLVTVGPQVDYYQPGSTVDVFVQSGKDMGDGFTPQRIGRSSFTAGILIGEADVAKGIKKGFHKLFH